MKSQFACVAGGFLLGCATQRYTIPPAHLREEERREIEQQIRAEAAEKFQKNLDKILEVERTKTEHRMKRECTDKYRKDTKRHERDLAHALRIRDQAKASRDRQVEKRFQSERARSATQTALKNYQNELAQLEVRRALAEDSNSKLQRKLKSEEGRHAMTQQALGSLGDSYRTLLGNIAQLQAHIEQLELGDSSAKTEISKLLQHVKTLERQHKSHKKRKALLEEGVKDRDALLANDLSSQEIIATLIKRLQEFPGLNEATAKYDTEKKLREAAEARYINLEQEHMSCGNALAFANRKTKEARDSAHAKTKTISQLQGDAKKLQDKIESLEKERDDATKTHASEKNESDTKISLLQNESKKFNEGLGTEKEANKDLRKQLEGLRQSIPPRLNTSTFESGQLASPLNGPVATFAQNGRPEASSEQQSSTQPEDLDVDQQHDTPMETEGTATPVETPSDVADAVEDGMVDGGLENAPTTAPSATTPRTSSGPSPRPFANFFGNAIAGSATQSGPQSGSTPLSKPFPASSTNPSGNATTQSDQEQLSTYDNPHT